MKLDSCSCGGRPNFFDGSYNDVCVVCDECHAQSLWADTRDIARRCWEAMLATYDRETSND